MSEPKPIEVIIPQMGESIAEATITGWRKQVGDTVDEGEALFDISTAKVEVEIPAPANGIVAKILAAEGDTLPIDTVVALIAPPGVNAEKVATVHQAESEVVPEPAPPPKSRPEPVVLPTSKPTIEEQSRFNDTEAERRHLVKRRSTPLVRNIAADLGIDLKEVQGTGRHGRVTKRDIETFLASQKKLERMQAMVPSNPAVPGEARPGVKLRPGAMKLDTVAGPFSEPIESPPEIVSVTGMRRLIADNLTRSSQQIPHAYTVHEIDFTQLEKVRLRYKPIFEQQFQTRLTPLVFLISAVTDALLKTPAINASWMGDRIQRHNVVNIGIAVAVRDGLVVPVIRNVESMSLAGIARSVVDAATRARSGQLKPADMEGGTFTITSPGQLGAVMAVPIILPPQGGILHLGAIQKVPKVVTGPDGEDSLAIRQCAMLTLGIDHRLIDGWEADQFMLLIKERIQRADFGIPA